MNHWEEFPHAQVAVVRERVKDVVKRCYGKTLEVGCNEGFLTKAIMEKGLDVVAVDCSDDAIQRAKDCFGIDVVKAFGEILPFPSHSFDTVVGAEVLEHVDNPGTVLAELFRVSKGHVILTLPIGNYWLGEPTHKWCLQGAVVEHDEQPNQVQQKEKHVFVIEFIQRK
jgi:2-polyprenyl-3-methyl-5-hydroxy-6-metoxy-1,4-benzoquinol methylase